MSWDEFKQKKYVIYDCPTWDEWKEIKKEYGYGDHDGGLHWFYATGKGLETPSGKIEFVSSLIKERDPDNKERPPLAKWLPHAESPGSRRQQDYPLAVTSNHPRFRFHVQGDDVDWIREIAKIKGPDSYQYEPCWIYPSDAGPRGIATGDIIKLHNDRGTVLFGAVVTERIIPGAVCVEHGAKIDMARLDNALVDRGGCINMIAPSPQEKYGVGKEITIPEMNVSGFLVEATRVEAADIVAIAEVGRPVAQG